MRKIVSNTLIVSTQLIVGFLFLVMLFSNENENSKVVMIQNNNLYKMSDSVAELFVVDSPIIDITKEELLVSVEEKEAIFLEESTEEVVVQETPVIEEVIVVPPVEEVVVPQPVVVVDPTGYITNPSVGFNVTTGNRTYSLTDEEFAILATVVNCEANRSSKDDILGVMSVILNRADSPRYPNDPVSVVAAPNQFSCYTGNVGPVSDLVASVIRDALNGIRNNNYYGFRSWQSVSYSNNYIVERGNRYG